MYIETTQPRHPHHGTHLPVRLDLLEKISARDRVWPAVDHAKLWIPLVQRCPNIEGYLVGEMFIPPRYCTARTTRATISGLMVDTRGIPAEDQELRTCSHHERSCTLPCRLGTASTRATTSCSKTKPSSTLACGCGVYSGTKSSFD